MQEEADDNPWGSTMFDDMHLRMLSCQVAEEDEEHNHDFDQSWN